jgi:trehalose synthase
VLDVMAHVRVPRRPVAELGDVIGLRRMTRLLAAAAHFRRLAAGKVIWTFSSTTTGGGVAEMLRALVGYTLDLAIDIRWHVIEGDGDFFRITKRLHNRIHGHDGDGGPLGPAERAHIESVLTANADAMADQVQPGDIVLLHDPQTAGLAGPLARRGAHVVWRCHVGTDGDTDVTRRAWEFLRPDLAQAQAYLFSRASYVPAFLPPERTWVIPPSIDPFSPKNQVLDESTVDSILTRMRVLSGPAGAAPRFVRGDGTPGTVTTPALVVADELPTVDDPVVLQVSRWDQLKDMTGVMRGFAAYAAPAGPGRLVLAGPAVEAVTDDPEGAVVYAQCLAQWHGLPRPARRRVVLATLPMDDVDENAAMVNALQRHARVVVQKSLVEGFGLTVAEGMWKGRAVIGSAVGGIQDQITAQTGILLPDPGDLAAFGHAVRRVLDEPGLADAMGAAAHELVRERFVGDLHLLRLADVFAAVLGAPRRWRAGVR